MNLEKYELETDKSYKVYQFLSIGTKGHIRKIIQFQPIDNHGLHNLAFGDCVGFKSDFDDYAISDNGDTEKVLATVVAALYSFFDHYPYAAVYATGSTPPRTRLYRMGIARYHIYVEEDLEIFGKLNGALRPFSVGTDYEAFLVRRKFR